MAVEKVSPGQKVLNRYLYTGGVFAALAALTIAHYTWVSPDWLPSHVGCTEALVCSAFDVSETTETLSKAVPRIAVSHKPRPTLLWFALSFRARLGLVAGNRTTLHESTVRSYEQA